MTKTVVIRAPAGLGKTSLVVKKLAHRTGGLAEVYVPTHALAEEVGRDLREANPQLKVNVIAGRSHPGTDGKPLCKKHRVAEEVARGGGEVYASLCARERGKREERCEYYESCPYIAQFTPAQVTIYPHAYLPLERMRLEPGVPEIAIIDETFIMSCIERFEVPLSILRSSCGGSTTLRVCAEIEYALTRGLPLFQHLYSVGIAFEVCREALREIQQRGGNISPAMSEKEQLAALQQRRQTNQLRKLLEVVWLESHVGRLKSHGIQYCPTTQKINVYGKKQIRRFAERRRPGDHDHHQSRVFVIDANADEQLIGQFFDDVVFWTIPAVRQAKVIQCRSTRCSTTSLVPKRNSDPKSKREAKKRLGELNAFIARIARQHARVLVVGPQAITGNPKTKTKPLIKAPANVDLAHFNAIRGIDRWKDHEAIVVIGRNEPPIEEVEAIARCVFLTDREPLQFASEWAVAERGYRWKGGRLGVDVVVHPDLRVQKILEQIREGESQQAIDRIRLIHATAPKAVYLLSNVVLDVDVDHLVTWEELMNGGSRIEQAWKTLNGVMPLAPEWLATQFPQLWNTADAAKADVGRGIKECQFTNMITISNPTLFKHQYRPTGALGRGARQRSWSMCVSSDADPAATRGALEALLGVAIEMRRPESLGVPLQQSTKHQARSTPPSNQARSTPYVVHRPYLGRRS